jgi:hypothetical protein
MPNSARLFARLSSFCSRGTFAFVVCAGATACDVNAFVADSTGKLLHQAAPSLDAFFDYETAGAGLPGVILQLEAFYSVTQNNEMLSLDLAKAYVGYAQGWIEADLELADAKGDLEGAERARGRARNHYLRARNLALHAMRVRDPGIDEALQSGEEGLSRYLREHYESKDDAPPLLWAGLAWGAAVNMSLDDPSLILDLPLTKILVRRSMDLDDLFFNGGAYLFMGTAEATLPRAMGGDPELAREWFEKGLERTGRKNHMMLVNYAGIWAVNNQDRETFRSLLSEVLEAADLGPSVRLVNKVARVRAERLLALEDTLF